MRVVCLDAWRASIVAEIHPCRAGGMETSIWQAAEELLATVGGVLGTDKDVLMAATWPQL